MTLKNNGAPLLCCFKLCASFHSYLWIQNGVTVWKRLNWVLTSVSLTFDLWPWPLAWTSLLSIVITPENFMMIQWQEHSENGVTDRQTDGRTDGQTERGVLRAAWSYLKKGTPYLALMGEVRGTNCEHLEKTDHVLRWGYTVLNHLVFAPHHKTICIVLCPVFSILITHSFFPGCNR